jgi:signal transduction histidine kinase
LNVSAIQSGKIKLERARYNLDKIIADCLDFFQKYAEEKNISLSFEKIEGIASPDVNVDKDRITQVIENLLSNAIRFTHPGGVVKIYHRIQGFMVAVYVEDTGQGLSDEDLKNIFTSFTKLSSKPTGGETSTGLGLVIAKKIIEMHDGSIEVKSEQGKGSIFSFTVPRKMGI